MFFFHFRRTQQAPPLCANPQALVARLMPYRQPDRCGSSSGSWRSLLIQSLHWNTPQSRLEPAPFVHGPSGLEAASWARLDNREELGGQLGIAPPELARCCDTELILRSYLRWGESCVDHLIGDFVFVIHDPGRHTVFCGRDHMGVRPLYYFLSEDVFACATSLAALDGVPLEIDPAWIAEYAIQLSMSFERTPYRGVRKLPPAHCLRVGPQDSKLRQYFQLSAEPGLRLADSREYVEAYREQLEEAIRCRLLSEHPLGSELSGGIDSSTITAFAARLLEKPERLHTFGYAFAELEAEHIQAVNQGCGLANAHLFSDRKAFHAQRWDRSLALLGYPEEHGNASFHEPIYQRAEQLGIRTLLSGFGGDEFGTTLHGYMVPMELALQGRYRELMNRLPGNPLTRFLRVVKLELRRRRSAGFTRVPPCGLFKASRQRWPHRIVREEWVQCAGLKERYFAAARFDEGYTDLKAFTLERRWAPFVPTRMENCTLMAAGRGIEYRWPLLDVRLVRLFLSIPSEENFFRGMGRYLHRRAIDGVVPGKVAWKPSKDMGAILSQAQDDPFPWLPSEPIKLHPGLAECLDLDLLRRQIAQLPALPMEAGDPRGFQFRKNIHAVLRLSAWMEQREGVRGGE